MKHTTLFLLLTLSAGAQSGLSAQTETIELALKPTTHDESTHDEPDDIQITMNHEEEGHEEEGHEEQGHEEQGHEEEGHEESEAGVVELSKESMRAAGVLLSTLVMEQMLDSVSAPGEVQLNQYSSAEVTPLVNSVVVERHARLGDSVEANQAMVTLVSVEVAQAQGQLRIAFNEWQRVAKLGKTAIGAKRFTEAQVAYEQAKLTLSAYGLDAKQIDSIAKRALSGSLGRFDLTAPLSGTVLLDDFRIGQRIEAGQRLFLIADESQIWIEANLTPLQAKNVEVGVAVQVKMSNHWHSGTVIQKHHLLDEQTRTVPLRIAVVPDGEHHHAGEFVQVAIELAVGDEEDSNSAMTLVVSESALMQDDAQNWTVFVEEKPGHFRQTVVTRGVTRGTRVAITGIDEGTTVVATGAFFLAAELAKSGFDIHNH